MHEIAIDKLYTVIDNDIDNDDGYKQHEIGCSALQLNKMQWGVHFTYTTA